MAHPWRVNSYPLGCSQEWIAFTSFPTVGRQQTVWRSLRSSNAFRFALGVQVPSLCKRNNIWVWAPACIATCSTSIGPDLQIAKRVPVAYSVPRGETLRTIFTRSGIARGCLLTATCPSVVVHSNSKIARHLSAVLGWAFVRCSTKALTAPASAAHGRLTWKHHRCESLKSFDNVRTLCLLKHSAEHVRS
jgi:hypothetical protein